MVRYYYDKKECVEDYRFFSVSVLKKIGIFGDETGIYSWKTKDHLTSIVYQVSTFDGLGHMDAYFTKTSRDTGEKIGKLVSITLISTPCNLGGYRWWFICPYAKTRCTKLYICNNGMGFASRKHLNLTYASRNLSSKGRFFQAFYKPESPKPYQLYKTIKYKYRNGRPTRKMRKYLKDTWSPYTLEERTRLETAFFS